MNANDNNPVSTSTSELVATFTGLRQSVDNIITRLELLDLRLLDMVATLSLFNGTMNVSLYGIQNNRAADVSKAGESSTTATSKTISETTKKVGALVKRLGSAGDAGLKMADGMKWMEKVSEKTKKITKLINVVKPVGEAIEAVGKIGAATETIEVLTASASLVAGAESVAATLATFGSVPGLVAGGVILAGGAIVGNILHQNDQQQQKKAIREKTHADNISSFYYPGIDEYKAITTLPVVRLQEKKQDVYNPIVDLSLHTDPTPVVPVLPVADNLYVAPLSGYPKRNDHSIIPPPNSWDNTVATRDTLVNIANEKGYVTYHNTVYDFLNGKSDLGKGMSKQAKETSARLANDVLLNKAKNNAGASVQEKENHSGPSITFNRALIEHFTINVKDSREGLRDFKRKVEEVLVEILNSVTYN